VSVSVEPKIPVLESSKTVRATYCVATLMFLNVSEDAELNCTPMLKINKFIQCLERHEWRSDSDLKRSA
jgi:hypothetical protein